MVAAGAYRMSLIAPLATAAAAAAAAVAVARRSSWAERWA